MPRPLAATLPALLAPPLGPARPPPSEIGGRYHLGARIAEGGMGEVWQAIDAALGRPVAIKLLRAELGEEARAQGLREARLLATLQHPGIVPVYDAGCLPDGRPYLVMRPVDGQPLGPIIAAVHAASSSAGFRPAPDGTSLHRLVDQLRRAAEAVAWAHERGVLHRDLKPDNILIGRFGEVELVDFGLAAPLGEQASRAGTPAYAAPEAWTGGLPTPALDVFGLGACLHEILTGEPPWPLGAPGPAPGAPPTPPPALRELCDRALDPVPARRPPSARAFAEALRDWLEQAGRQLYALRRVEEADVLLAQAQTWERQAGELRAAAGRRLAGLPVRASAEERAPGWALEDEARRAEQDAGRTRADAVSTLLAALTHDPDCAPAQDRLADYHLAAHDAARARGSWEDAAQAARLVELHGARRHRAWIAGESRLTLITAPAGVAVRLRPFVEVGRRLLPGEPLDLGPTPILDRAVAAGSFLAELSGPDGLFARLPLNLPRGGQCTIGPGPAGRAALDLGPARRVPPGACLVLGGLFSPGGDPVASTLPDRALWVPTFAMMARPVTHGDWLRFLDALVAAGDEAQAIRCAPRAPRARPGDPAGIYYGRRPDGGFCLIPDPEGDLWQPDWPVNLVDAFAAEAYARFCADRDGLPWRLPSEVEWEKAARGADGRPYPWGHHLDPCFTCMRDSHAGRPLPASVDAYPTDQSPYGIFGLAGNMRGWCLEAWQEQGPAADAEGRLLLTAGGEGQRAVRGASWSTSPLGVRAAHRSRANATGPRETIGVRLACSLGD